MGECVLVIHDDSHDMVVRSWLTLACRRAISSETDVNCMKRIVCSEPGVLRMEETDFPKPRAGEALVRIRRVGVCGTDIHAYRGRQPFFTYPRVFGHELSGGRSTETVIGSQGNQSLFSPICTAATVRPAGRANQIAARS